MFVCLLQIIMNHARNVKGYSVRVTFDSECHWYIEFDRRCHF